MKEVCISFLPTVLDGRVQQLRNSQMAGESKWVLSSRGWEKFDWQPTDASFYGYVGKFEEAWVPIAEGDTMEYITTTSASPQINCIYWRDGDWWAWVGLGEYRTGSEWVKLVVAD